MISKELLRAVRNELPMSVTIATLGEDGRPKPEFFLADRLHMNAKGYAIWTSIIEPYLK